MVTCVYVNPELDRFRIIDYRIYDPARDGKSKLEPVREMLVNAVQKKQLLFRTLLMDTWYAAPKGPPKLMRWVEDLGKLYYCPRKDNRRIDESSGAPKGPPPYQRIAELSWHDHEQQHGKLVHIKDFPKGHRLKLFRLALSTDGSPQGADSVATNDLAQDVAPAAQEACALRWKIEQFHRKTKQVTGIERGQCRKARSQRNHIGCAILLWIRLKHVAEETARTLYRVKHDLLADYMRQQLRSPTVKMILAA